MHQLLFEAATTLYTEALLRPLQFHWSTSENVHFQGAEEEALVPDQDRRPSTLVASEQHTHGDRASTAPGGQPGCPAWADPLPSSPHIYRGMFFSQLGILGTGVENCILVGSLRTAEKTSDRHLSLFTIPGLGLKWMCHKREFYLYY